MRRRSMRTCDKLVIPWVSRLERGLGPPIGQNLLAVAVKPGGSPDEPETGAERPERGEA